MRTSLTWAVVVAWAGGVWAAEAPKLTRSVPADGAKTVACEIGVIKLIFDRPMKMNTWTLWQSDKGAFPTMDLSDEDLWRDPQTCEIRIKALKPNTRYAIQLNSAKKQGFRSAEENEPLAVTLITFTTGDAAPDKPRDDAGKSADAGGAKNPLDSGGSKNPLDSGSNAKNPLDAGAKKPADDGSKNPLDADPRKPADTGTRPNPLDAPKNEPKDLAAKLIGTWRTATPQLEVIAIFRADGTCQRTERTAERSQTTRVTWKLNGRKLAIRTKEGEDVILNLTFKDADTIEVLDDDGEGLRMVRQKE